MKSKLNRTDLIKAINICSLITKENRIRPILSAIKISVSNKVTFEATDLEASIKLIIEAEEIIEAGEIAIQPEQLQYLNMSDSKYITLERKENILLVTDAENITELCLQDEKDYPLIKLDDNNEHKIASKTLYRGIARSLYATSELDNPALNCVRIEAKNGSVNFLASDTFKMSNIKETFDGDFSLSIPKQSALTILKLINNTEEVNFTVYENKLNLSVQNIVFSTRLINLPFPNWRNIFENLVTQFTIQTRKNILEKVLKKIDYFAKDNINSRNGATFIIKPNKIELKAMNEKSKTKENIDIINESRKELKISLNVKFILDYLKNLETDTVINMSFSTNNTPVLIENEEDKENKLLMMPLAIID